jgi:hypothetical protein
MSRLRLALCVVLALACRTAASPGSPPSAGAAALTGAPCSVATEATPAEEWREVRADGFTFCVPPGWAGDARTGRVWRGDGAEVRWGTGSGREMTTTTRERISRGDILESRADAAQRMIDESQRELREVDEVIGGRPARLTYNRANGTYYASARWEEPAVYFTGTARTLAGAARAMQLYRTVRFDAPAAAGNTGTR